MKRSEDRILTTHTGALHRPKELQGLALQRYKGELEDEAAYEQTLTKAVADVVRKQAELGIDIVNDGEFTKSTWFTYVAERMDGIEFLPGNMQVDLAKSSADRAQFADCYQEAVAQQWYTEQGPEFEFFLEVAKTTPTITGPLEYSGHAEIERDIANLKAALDGVDVEEAFLTVVVPGSIQPALKNEYYSSDEDLLDLFKALADALHEEYKAIVDAGLICQIDDAFLPWEWDRRALEPDMIEAANARHEWEYHVWEEVKLPDGKILQPGVIAHVTNVVEHPRTVADRIIRYAERVGRENVIAGTDCGLRMRCHPQVAWAKLQALGDDAEIASKELWK